MLEVFVYCFVVCLGRDFIRRYFFLLFFYRSAYFGFKGSDCLFFVRVLRFEVGILLFFLGF